MEMAVTEPAGIQRIKNLNKEKHERGHFLSEHSTWGNRVLAEERGCPQLVPAEGEGRP